MKFGRWELGIGFDNPIKQSMGQFDFLSINWEIGWAYYLTICNIAIGISLTDKAMSKLLCPGESILCDMPYACDACPYNSDLKKKLDLSKTQKRLEDLGIID